MDIWNSLTYRNDITDIIATLNVESLKNKSILITGASGLICSAVVDLLIFCNLTMNAGITVYAAGREEAKIRNRFKWGINAGLKPVVYDATQDIKFNVTADYIIHGASNASPEQYIREPVETMLANIYGVKNLLEYAIKTNTQKFLYISSSEVYGKLNHGNPLIEDEYGTVDILSLRAAYPMGKRAAETMCISYANQYGINVSIVRPGHIYGPTSQFSDKRIASLFTRQAACGQNLVMKSTGMQLRSYCHCLDCASAILTVLMKGETKQAYNVSNKNSVITIRQMAEIIARYADVELCLDVPSETEKAAFNPMNNSSLNSQKLEMLGWQGQFDAEKGFSHTIKVLKELEV